MKKITMFIFVFFCTIATITAQENIKMSFQAELRTHPHINRSYARYTLYCIQTIELSHYDNDTLFLYVKMPHFGINKSMVNGYYPNLNVNIKSADDVEYKNANFDFNGRIMKIETTEKNSKIQIEYPFFNTYFPRTDLRQMLAFISPYISDYTSWYFSPNYEDTIRFESLTLNVPENTYFFATCPYEQQEQQYILNTQKTQDKDISFFVLEKAYYEKYEIKPNVNVFFSRGVFVDLENQIRIPLDSIDQEIVNSRLNTVKRTVSKIESIFGTDNDYIIDIADAYRKRGKFVEGNTYSTSDNSSFVYIDSAFWNISSFVHELIHCYTPFAKDSSGYFFSESMTEYLATYLFYEDAYVRDSIFTDKILIYSGHKDIVNKSIFDLSKNSTQLNVGYGTSKKKKKKIPFIIHTLAKRVGEEKFINILKQFYRQAKEKGRTDFADFENILKANGVGDTTWRIFRNAL
jgi:hypothetical protein